MKEKDKELLLRDLCTRLSYGIKGLAYIVGEPCNTDTKIIGIINKSIVTDYKSPMLEFINFSSKDIIIKPYLRPKSSMTKEEIETYHSYCECNDGDFNGEILYFDTIESFDYLNSIHIDYRGLIEKGLAIEASKDMYDIK